MIIRKFTHASFLEIIGIVLDYRLLGSALVFRILLVTAPLCPETHHHASADCLDETTFGVVFSVYSRR